jgi:hypothetical protein
MYEIGGRQYLLVSASGDVPEAGLPPDGGPPANRPKGYVAFALPKK